MSRASASSFSANSRFVACSDQISCELDGEAAILNLKTGFYFGLDPIGAEIWRMLTVPRRLCEIVDAISSGYDVAPDRCERDLAALLRDLHKHGLIETRDE